MSGYMNNLKNNTIGKKNIKSQEQLHKDVIGFLRLLQIDPFPGTSLLRE